MKRLSKMVPQVFATLRQAPPTWIREFDAWCAQYLGPKPSYVAHRRASEDWELAVMGALLAWGYFAEAFAADVPVESAVEGPADNPEVAAVPGAGADAPVDSLVALDEPPADVPAEVPANLAADRVSLADRLAVRPHYAVLGADGQPLIEGVRGLEDGENP